MSDSTKATSSTAREKLIKTPASEVSAKAQMLLDLHMRVELQRLYKRFRELPEVIHHQKQIN